MPNEKLSALLDDACSDAEIDSLLAEFERDAQLGEQWSRLCIAHEVRQGTRIRRQQVDIVAGVMDRLTRESAALPASRVVTLAPRRRIPWRPLAGLAMAASVAALAVSLGLNFGAVESVPGVDAAPGALQTVALEAAPLDDDLRQYLIEHSSAAADRGVGGALSYARFAVRTADAGLAQTVAYETGGTQP